MKGKSEHDRAIDLKVMRRHGGKAVAGTGGLNLSSRQPLLVLADLERFGIDLTLEGGSGASEVCACSRVRVWKECEEG